MSDGDTKFWLVTTPATLRERRLSFTAMAIFFVVCCAIAPFAAVPLPPITGFIPSNEGMIFIVALVTAIFLYARFSVIGLRAQLILANGYLFSALMVIPHALTFPGSFSPLDFGASAQTAGWLYVAWHFGFFAAAIYYAWVKERTLPVDASRDNSNLTSILWSVVLVIGLVLALTWFILLFDEWLPRLLLNEVAYSPLVRVAGGLNVTLGLIALAILWTRGNSVLDQWLMVAVFSLISEVALVSFFVSARFNVGFYSGHIFATISSTIVLAALLTEAAGLVSSLERTLKTVQRERDSKLLSMEAVAGAIAHEVNQPITAVALEGTTASLALKRQPPNLEEIGESLDAIVEAAHRGSAILKEIRELFTTRGREVEAVDVNRIVREALSVMREELKAHDVTAQTELAVLPSIMGHGGQLEQVILNLLRNAVDALRSVTDRPRILRVRTEWFAKDRVSIVVEDSGPGIDPQLVGKIFETYVTTKPSGMGLGLYLSRMIIQRHGGDISVSSPGVGAKFRVVLPLRL